MYRKNGSLGDSIIENICIISCFLPQIYKLAVWIVDLEFRLIKKIGDFMVHATKLGWKKLKQLIENRKQKEREEYKL